MDQQHRTPRKDPFPQIPFEMHDNDSGDSAVGIAAAAATLLLAILTIWCA